MTLAELLALLADLSALDDEALAQLLDDLRAAADELAQDASDDALASLDSIAEGVEAIAAEQEAREAEAADRQARAEAALDRIRGPEGEPEPEPAEPVAEAPEPEPEGEPEPEPAPEAVAAAAARPRPARTAARRPAAMSPDARPKGAQDPSKWGLVASANLAGFQAGERLDDAGKIADAMWAAVQSTRGYTHGPRVKVRVARAGSDRPEDLYPDERVLTSDVRSNLRKIQAATSRQALAASGGICVNPQINYDQPVWGSQRRPVRDNLMVRFGADRGGVRTLPPPIIDDLEGAIGFWTEANDVNPTDPETKPCLTLTCPDEVDGVVEAVTKCLQYGNFRARFFAEQINAWMELAAIRHAREAEQRLLGSIGGGSTQVTTGEGLGATQDVLATLGRAVAVLKSRHRLEGVALQWGIPFWLLDMIRVNQAREIPNGTLDERFAVADATILGWFRAWGVTPTLLLDGESGQEFGAQGDGALQGWPSSVVSYLYPSGSWLFLDGGTLDLGIVRDSTLNSTNDVQAFAETFEGAHFNGVETWRLSMDLCPSGAVSGAVEFDPCATGS